MPSPSLAPTLVSGSASPWVADRLAAAPHEGTLVHAGRDAVYLASRGDVIGVASRHACVVACTISTGLDHLDTLFPDRHPAPGDVVTVGGGGIRIGAAQVRVGRFRDVLMPRLAPDAAPVVRERLSALAGDLPRCREIDGATLDRLRERPDGAALEVLGRGSGLTPLGDDVLCGLLVTLQATGDRCTGALATTVVEHCGTRTTALSATLLRRAAAGEAGPDLVRAVTDLATRPQAAPGSIARLRSVGHTSGSGMLLGLLLALDHVVSRSCR